MLNVAAGRRTHSNTVISWKTIYILLLVAVFM